MVRQIKAWNFLLRWGRTFYSMGGFVLKFVDQHPRGIRIYKRTLTRSVRDQLKAVLRLSEIPLRKRWMRSGSRGTSGKGNVRQVVGVKSKDVWRWCPLSFLLAKAPSPAGRLYYNIALTITSPRNRAPALRSIWYIAFAQNRRINKTKERVQLNVKAVCSRVSLTLSHTQRRHALGR